MIWVLYCNIIVLIFASTGSGLLLFTRVISTGVEDEDLFFHCDPILFLQLLPRSTGERWISLREYTPQFVADHLTMHDRPPAKRLKLVSEGSLDRIEIASRGALKSTFLSSLRQASSRMNQIRSFG